MTSTKTTSGMTRRTTRPPRTTWWATATPRTKLKTPKTHSHTLTHQEPTHQASYTHTHTHTHIHTHTQLPTTTLPTLNNFPHSLTRFPRIIAPNADATKGEAGCRFAASEPKSLSGGAPASATTCFRFCFCKMMMMSFICSCRNKI
jgi:hypothetical protein